MADDKITRREFLAKSALSAATIAVSSAGGLAPSRALGANDRLSIGLIGAGSRGSQDIAELHKVGADLNVEITAVCDTWRIAREKTAGTVKEWYGKDCRQFSNYEDLLALGDIDGVIIATPDFGHSKILAAALKAGKDAYCEKPMASELADANLAMDAAAGGKRVVQIGTQRRSDGKWKAAAKMVQSGMLGTISRVEIGWNDNGPRWNRKFDDLKAEDVDWKRFLMGKPDMPFDAKKYRCWQMYRDYTNGPIAILGAHYLDVASWLMDDPFPSTAVGHGGHYLYHDGREHEDTVYALYDYPKGFMCRYLTGLGNSAESGMKVYGTEGMFTEATWEFNGVGAAKGKGIKEAIKVQAEPSVSHVGNWIECMRSRAITNAPIEVGYRHAVATIMGYQAMHTGKKLKYLAEPRKIVEAETA